MAILKNEPIYPFTKGNYAKPHYYYRGSGDSFLAKEKYDSNYNIYGRKIFSAQLAGNERTR